MIFTTTPIKDETIIVRFYHYADPHNGYGDAGTVRYMRIPLTQFACVKDSDFKGKPYYRYTLDGDVSELLPDLNWYGIGYEQSTEERQLKELRAAELHYQQLATIHEL
jgi:hypothetical protein